MDTSETYIKMCDCPEIQSLRPFKASDIIGDYYNSWGLHKLVWLLRQDELQEMITPEVEHGWQSPFLNFALWALPNPATDSDNKPLGIYRTINCFSSMEQLWLAFVMKEKYDKTWNGTEWHNGD